MAEETTNETTNDEGLEEGIEEALPQEEEVQEEEQEQPDYSSSLRQAKMEALIAAYLPDGTDIDTELSHVGGLEIDSEGNVSGEAVYRKPQVANMNTKKQTSQPKIRKVAAPVDNWEQRKACLLYTSPSPRD